MAVQRVLLLGFSKSALRLTQAELRRDTSEVNEIQEGVP